MKLNEVMKCIAIMNMIFSILLLAILCQGRQATSDSSRSPRQMQRDNFFVIRNTPNGLLAMWDHTQSREKCRDKHPSCPIWGSRGECHRNPNYMVPNCAYTCNTCLIGVSNNNGVRNNNGVQNNIDTRNCKNAACIQEGIRKEANFIGTGTVENVDMAATTASNTILGNLAGKEVLILVAEAVKSSAIEYTIGCQDMFTTECQGNCDSNPSFMYVNCPRSCDSCLPEDSSECVNRSDNPESCDLSAALGLCEVNYSYNLRFCSYSCRNTQSLRGRCIKNDTTCSQKSLRNPDPNDFECGVQGLNRRKRLVMSILPAQSREARRLKQPSRRNRKKNNKIKRKRKQKKKVNISEEKIGLAGNITSDDDMSENTGGKDNEDNNHSRPEDSSVKQSNQKVNTSATYATSRQGPQEPQAVPEVDDTSVCCSLNLTDLPFPEEECTHPKCDYICSTHFRCFCCAYPDLPSTKGRRGSITVEDPRVQAAAAAIGLFAGLAAGAAALQGGAPGAGTGAGAGAGASSSSLTSIAEIGNIASSVMGGFGLAGAAPVAASFAPISAVIAASIVPLVTASVIAAVPPSAHVRGINADDIQDTIANKNAARVLLPFCNSKGYLELLKQLDTLISLNTGKPLNARVFEITEAITFCRHGIGQIAPDIVSSINIATNDTGFGNFSDTDNPGVSTLGLSGIAALGRTTENLRNDRGKFFCGASLITKKHILTAAHCVIPNVQDVKTIRLGEIDFTKAEGSERDYNITKITPHPDYVLLSSYNDIAVIELAEDVTGDFVPFCLPSKQKETDELEEEIGTVSGWGTRPNKLPSQFLVSLNVTVRSFEKCKEAYDNSIIFKLRSPGGLSNVSLCANGVDGMDVCRGDSGGPLVLSVDGKIEEIGIVSQGDGCGHPDYPGIYTRTDVFLDWLDEVVYGKDSDELCS